MATADRQAARDPRYERKFVTDRLDSHQVRALVKLHPAMFYEPYPCRFVNNIYLDSPGMERYAAHVNGAREREKVRIRWYGDLFGPIDRPALEFKVRRGSVGCKILYPLPPFVLDERFSPACLAELVRAAALPGPVEAQLSGLNPVLLNRYERAYFATRNSLYRLTVDSGLVFYGLGGPYNRFLCRHAIERDVVVELKYGVEHERGATRIAAGLPFTLTRHSKYVRGVEAVCLPFSAR